MLRWKASTSPQLLPPPLSTIARVTMVVSALLRHGIEHLQSIEQELAHWLEEHEYHSVRQLQGTMSQAACPTPSEFERVQYMKAIQTYRPYRVQSR